MYIQFGLGVGVAATVRVGNELGAGNSTAAKRAAYISLALGGESVTLGCSKLVMLYT